MASESLPSVTPDLKAVLRVLHLEDSVEDRELVRDTLAAGGLRCDVVPATTKDEFVAALGAAHFDLILSDFTMPGYDGSQALDFVQRTCPDVPYIFVSGTIGEQQAIDSLKSGAMDYVLKEDLDRLVPAVRRAMREAAERARRRAAEAALRKAEARYRNIFEQAVEGIYQSTADGRPLDVNRTMARLCGYASPDEFCQQVENLTSLYLDPERRLAFSRLLQEQGEVLGHEAEIRRRDGATIWISENARAVRDTGSTVLYFESMITDITARRVAEEALRQSEERFRAMAGSIDHVFRISAEAGRRLLYVSPAYEQIWGRPVAQLYAHPDIWLEAVLAEERETVRVAHARAAAGEDYRIEYRIRRPDGSLRWIEDRGYPLQSAAGEDRRAAGVAVDITHRRELEEQLRQAQKMEAIGQLAGGVAHDFNNVLTVISGYSRLLLDGGTLPPDAVEPLTQIYTAGARAASLTRQLLLFSRKQTADRRVFDLNHVVEEISKMLGRLIGEHIGLRLTLAPGSCPVEADAGMIEQILMNLAVNSRDAMTAGGTLIIATERVSIAPTEARHPSARPGEFIALAVRDTGCGIPPENLARIYEPFFTTKEVGHGTGLGLATVFGIVQQHHGWIEVESTVGAGTCFRILLPAAPEEALAPARRTGKAAPVNGGTETVLLVEDEATVREFALAVLRSHGYRVLQAKSGVDALEVWKWHKSRIALLFSDLVMPEGIGGVDLAAILRTEKPTLKVVLASGYASDPSGAEFKPPPGTHFIRKPYKPQALARLVRDALDGSFNR